MLNLLNTCRPQGATLLSLFRRVSDMLWSQWKAARPGCFVQINRTWSREQNSAIVAWAGSIMESMNRSSTITKPGSFGRPDFILWVSVQIESVVGLIVVCFLVFTVFWEILVFHFEVETSNSPPVVQPKKPKVYLMCALNLEPKSWYKLSWGSVQGNAWCLSSGTPLNGCLESWKEEVEAIFNLQNNIHPGPFDWCDGASVLGFCLMISSSLIPCANCHPRFWLDMPKREAVFSRYSEVEYQLPATRLALSLHVGWNYQLNAAWWIYIVSPRSVIITGIFFQNINSQNIERDRAFYCRLRWFRQHSFAP